MHKKLLVCTVLAVAANAANAFAQRNAPEPLPLGERGCPGPGIACASPINRPPLFLRAEWKRWPDGKEHPATPDRVASPNLVLRFYGPSAKDIQLTGTDELDPVRLWTGLCTSPIAVALAHKERYVDLTRRARISWGARTSGYHVVRVVVKLANGTWLAGDHAFAATEHEYVSEDFAVKDVRWRRLDIDRVVTVGEAVNNPDLTQVDEIGFADLMPGSGHGAGGFITVTDIEVYAQPGKRR